MELNRQIGKNLKRIRQERGLSINQLTELCGLSSVMLSQIEKGTANPTINTLWKIATGLKVPYTMLLEEAEEEATVVVPDEEKMQYSPDGKCRVFCYYPVSPLRKYEMFTMELKENGQYISPGHPQRSREYLIVNTGALKVTTGQAEYTLQEGESLTFAAAVPHVYENVFNGKTKIVIVNDYTE